MGHWTLIDFGYTFCPDVCPGILLALKDLKARQLAQGHPSPRVLFVSVDAPRDTPQRLAEFVHGIDPAFTGATGDDAALAPLTKHLGVYYQRMDAQDKRLTRSSTARPSI